MTPAPGVPGASRNGPGPAATVANPMNLIDPSGQDASGHCCSGSDFPPGAVRANVCSRRTLPRGQGTPKLTPTSVAGQYQGTVRVHRRVFQRMLDQSPTPERCLEAFHLQRTRFEVAVERKLRRRQLTDDGNVEITGRDPRERDPRPLSRVDRPYALEAR